MLGEASNELQCYVLLRTIEMEIIRNDRDIQQQQQILIRSGNRQVHATDTHAS